MSIRIKAVLIIVSIVALITASSMVISMYFSSRHLVETIEGDMAVVSRIAVKLISTNLRLLKTETDVAAEAALAAAVDDAVSRREQALPAVLAEQARLHNFLALTVLGSREVIASWGEYAPGRDFIGSPYARRAFIGERVITTTTLAPDGRLLIRICVPMGSRILVATLPGMILSDIISEFRIWNTGNILLLDGEGIIIANIRPALVNERRVLTDVVDRDPKTGGLGPFFAAYGPGKTGTGIYSFGGVPRVGAYTPVSGSDDWMLIVAAPIEESPGNRTSLSLLVSAAVFMGLGILAASIAGRVIAYPFARIQEQNAHLAELRVTAENASRAKSDFLSNMSHEMRTPLNAIIGMTSIARSSPDMERKDYCLTKIEDASAHLLGVINDILDMSKIEANKLELSPETFNFEKMLQKVVNVINFKIDQKRQRFIVRLDKDIPLMLTGDDQRIAQVIANLLSNAVKFTPEEGSIRLDTRLLEERQGVCTIRISVSDTGIGITAEQQAKLFSSFAQAESSTSRKFGGTGLGLAISKRLVEMMKGRIWLESEAGKGSTFSFTIQAERAGGGEEALRVSAPDRSALRILAVDDDPEVLEYFAEIAGRYGFPCDLAAGGEEACALVEKNGPYPLCFIDWRMPGMDGIELARRIKSAAGSNSLIIMISAAEWSVIEAEAKEAGVDKFLAKPLFPSAVVDYINRHLETGHYRQLERAGEDSGGCFAGRRILLAEDVKINQEIVLALLEPTGLEIDCADNGKEAVERFSAAPEKYDMIFMDVQMPEMDGYEATRTIREFEKKRQAAAMGLSEPPKGISIIAMTANVFREDIEKCLACGMDGHVGKPIDINEVMDRLRRFLPADPPDGKRI
ncbi:MAG: response regulator [Treponema sp.]|jgi:signal transduction histidine kinase/DNA-binding response OmpR family regulator|nr:response regulator [Treponema sp.]